MSSATLDLELVRAGAGAGKTTRLVAKVRECFEHFSSQKNGAPRLIVCTFTRKATQELRERLIKDAFLHQDAEYMEFVTQPSRLHISTIHGVLSLFLRRYGQLTGVDSAFQVIGEEQNYKLAKSILRELLLTANGTASFIEEFGFRRLLEMLLAADKALTQWPDLRPASLKDLEQATMRRRQILSTQMFQVAELILAETSDNEMIQWAQNLQSVSQELPRQGAVALDSLTSKPRLKKNRQVSESTNEVIKSCLDEVKKRLSEPYHKTEFWQLAEQRYAVFHTLAKDFQLRLRKKKLHNGQMELADLELMTLHLLRQHPEVGQLFALDWDYWLIDEYQDTSPLQVQLLAQLMGPQPAFVVGDPQQSIYLFRGARSEVFHERQKWTEAQGGKTDQLTTNYRARPQLLHFLNDFFAQISDQFVAMSAAKKEASSDTVTDPVAFFLNATSQQDELQAIAHRIFLWRKQRDIRWDEICVLGRTHRDLLIIARYLKFLGFPTHVHSAAGFTERREIMDVKAILRFLINPHDNLNLLVVLRSPWFHIADAQLYEWMQSKPQSLWMNLVSKPDLFINYDPLGRLKILLERKNQFGLVNTFINALETCGLLDMVSRMDVTGTKEANLWKFIEQVTSQEKSPGINWFELGTNPLVQTVGRIASDSNDFAAEGGDAVAAREPNCINLMTIHASKGLEFDYVIVPNIGDGPRSSRVDVLQVDEMRRVFSFPVFWEAEQTFCPSAIDRDVMHELSERESAEYERLLYVALTRAKHAVAMSWNQENIAKQSWLSRCRWSLETIGLNVQEHYCYSIEVGPFSLIEWREAHKTKPPVREPWQKLNANEALDTELSGRIAVTRLLEARSRQKTMPVDQAVHLYQQSASGVIFHKLFEALKSLSFSEVESLAKAWCHEPKPILHGLKFIEELKNPPMKTLIANGQVEWGFRVKTKFGLLEGQIDLWGMAPDEQGQTITWVVDYKTGSMKGLDKALQQLKIYAWALGQFGHSGPYRLVVVYPLQQQVKVIDYQLPATFDGSEFKNRGGE